MPKKDIHPEWYPEAKVICNGEVVMTVGSTQPELHVDVWSGNHPFFTGQQRIIDTAGQVDRFMKRLDQYSSHRESAKKRQAKVQKKLEQRFAKQQVVALNLDDAVYDALNEQNIVTIGDLEKKLKNDREGLLALENVDEAVVGDLHKRLNEARDAFFSES